MANVLATLFQDTAAAIREKTGDTATMKPAEFPDKIRAIEISGSGGGSLPAGVYLEPCSEIAPNKYYQWYFELNGDLYCMHNPGAGGSSSKRFLKYVDGAWVEVIATTSLYSSAESILVHNGKAHIYGGETVVHWIFDGSAVTRLNDLPDKIASRSMAVFNEKLYAYSCYDGGVYIWDEATDSWTLEATIGSKYEYYYPFVVGEDLLFVQLKNVYKYNDGVVEQKAKLSYSPDAFFVKQGNLYYTKGGYNKLWKCDLTTNAEVVAGNFASPYPNGIVSKFWMFGDSIRFTTNESLDATSVVENYIVHIVEETT